MSPVIRSLRLLQARTNLPTWDLVLLLVDFIEERRLAPELIDYLRRRDEELQKSLKSNSLRGD